MPLGVEEWLMALRVSKESLKDRSISCETKFVSEETKERGEKNESEKYYAAWSGGVADGVESP